MKTQFEVNEDFRVMENEELVYMLTKKNDFSQKAAEDLFGYPNTSSFSDVISQMTPAKRRLAMAAVELYKRLRENAAEPQKIMCSQDIYKLMYPYLGDIATEECWAVFLNQSSRVIKRFRVSCGGYSATQVDIRVILRDALLSRLSLKRLNFPPCTILLRPSGLLRGGRKNIDACLLSFFDDIFYVMWK